MICSNCSSKMKKIIKKILILVLILIILLVVFIIKKKHDNYEVGQTSQIAYHYENKVPNFIDGSFSNRLVKSSKDALLALNDIKDKMGIQDATKEFISEGKIILTYERKIIIL